MEKSNTIIDNLHQFHGSENLYKFTLGTTSINYTEGVLYLADTCQCYWLLDVILSYQNSAVITNEGFQVWCLQRFEENWLVSCTDGNSNLLLDQTIEFSDFPINKITLWLVNSTLLLPSEY